MASNKMAAYSEQIYWNEVAVYYMLLCLCCFRGRGKPLKTLVRMTAFVLKFEQFTLAYRSRKLSPRESVGYIVYRPTLSNDY
jgi:hypothetical protein